MNRRQQGMILVSTMLMISLLSMLVLSLLQMVFLYVKTSNYIVQQHKAFYQMEGLAERISLQPGFRINASCIIPEDNPNRVIRMLLQNQGCVAQEEAQHYRYVLEDLGINPCLSIAVGDAKYSSHHWRLSMLQDIPEQPIVQIRVALPSVSKPCAQTEQNAIPSGIISWRYTEGSRFTSL